MSKYIPVDPEKWAAMVIAQRDLVRYKEICDELDAECARLKEEVHRLEEIVGSDAIDRKYGMCCDASDEHARLKAEVERLTKAGDAMADAYLEEYRFNTLMIPPIDPDEVEAWHKAKGVQS